ncbi:MAG TPA: RsmE family RNA methyltransferase [Methylomirabilota bacterium]|nr:RsmE family RNA methyltransferase [Methylomirabilota bacterium]
MEKHRLPDTPFWVEPASVGSDHLDLSPEESHHLLHVHRARPGAPFQATDGAGGFYECVLESVKRHAAVGRIVERREGAGELPRPVEILVGIPDRRAIEQIIEHAVPLGVTAIDFVVCERSSPGGTLSAQRLVRLARIAKAALKQSRRSRLPKLGSSPSLENAIGGTCEGGAVPGAWRRYLADPDGQPFPSGRIQSLEAAIQLAIGPPGGFSGEERRLLLESGFSPISLGPSRLTTETAAIALISLIRNSL